MKRAAIRALVGSEAKASALGRRALPRHAALLLLLLGVAYAYLAPTLHGKRLLQKDKLQVTCSRVEFQEHFEQTGEVARWSNRQYAGMPADLMYSYHPSNLPLSIQRFFSRLLKAEVLQLYLYFLCFYLSMVALGFSPFLAFFGALAFGLSTENLVIVEVGHASKARAVAFAVPLLVGVYAYMKKPATLPLLLILGGTSFMIAMQHVQISYYAFLLAAIIWAFGFRGWRRRKYQRAGVATLVLMGALVIAAMPSVSQLWTTADYSRHSTRGEKIVNGDPSAKTGLARDYANAYSLGISETLTVLVPGLFGGTNTAKVGPGSETFRVIRQEGIRGLASEDEGFIVPLYWGDQPSRAGPFYLGIAVLVLFLLGLSGSSTSFRRLILTLIGVSLLIAWGRNVDFINGLLFDYFPFYDRFRSPTMVLHLASIFVVWTAVKGLEILLTQGMEMVERSIWQILASLSAICLIILVLGPLVADFSAGYRESIRQPTMDKGLELNLNHDNSELATSKLLAAMRQDRRGMLINDARRSLLLLILLAGCIYGYRRGTLRKVHVASLCLVLSVGDLWSVGKRYFNSADFVGKRIQQELVPLTPGDSLILADSRPGDRMVDIPRPVFQDARPVYYHATIGGNHGAKLQRYQDLIDHYLEAEIRAIRDSNNRVATPVINMLNTRYIKRGSTTRDVLTNVTASGHLWLADSIRWVESAAEELGALADIVGNTPVVVHEEFASYLQGFSITPVDADDRLDLLEYVPGRVRYRSSLRTEKLVVFSEIWHRPNEYWISSIDGVRTDHIRANYLLRAMRIPAGEHEITFSYEPTSYLSGEILSWMGSLLYFFALAGLVYTHFSGGAARLT